MMSQTGSSPYYEVQLILGKKIYHKAPLYLIKWKNYSIKRSSWEPKSSLTQMPQYLNEFEDKIKDKPLPYIEEQYFQAMQSNTSQIFLQEKKSKIQKKVQKNQKIEEKVQAKTLTNPIRARSCKKNSEGVSILMQTSQEKITFDDLQTTVDQNTFGSKELKGNQDLPIKRKYMDVQDKVKVNESKKGPKKTSENSVIEPNPEQKHEINPFKRDRTDQPQNSIINQRKWQAPRYEIRKMKDLIRSIKFQRKVIGKLLFDRQNLYEVSLYDGSLLHLKTSELIKDHTEEFVRYLETHIIQ